MQARNLYETVADAIRHHRKTRGWSQAGLASRLGVSSQSVSNWERGAVQQIEQDNLQRLAEVFEIDVRELLAAPRPSGLTAKGIEVAQIYASLPREGKLWVDYTLRRLQEVYGLKGGHPSGEQKGQKGHNSNEPEGPIRPLYVMSPQPRSDGEVFRGDPPMFDTDWPLLGAQTLSYASLS